LARNRPDIGLERTESAAVRRRIRRATSMPRTIKRKKTRTPKKQPSQIDHSTVAEHHHTGKTLVPPLASLPKMTPFSWMNDRLPEMLWAALLISSQPRSKALNTFRQVADHIAHLDDEKPPYDVTHTGLSELGLEVREGFIKVISATDERKDALRPLLLLRELPAREDWAAIINQTPSNEDWQTLMIAVARTLNHQSEESTDCRWARLICMMAAGMLRLPTEIAKEYTYYPDYGEQRKVRPSIRAAELALDVAAKITEREWPKKFWFQCSEDTPCFPLPTTLPPLSQVIGTTPSQVKEVYRLLVEHSNQTVTTTATDPRHDTVFGVALYSLNILQELLRIGASQSIIARIALRTLVEGFITLSYLAKEDNPELWKSYRVFGAGQAKLQYLKLEELGASPTYVNTETLKELANEDVWEEYLSIELGHWEKANLRSQSIKANVKNEYDTFYAWTSAFAHGHWGPVRDTVYDTCGNPLHRLHRIPRDIARALPDVIPDACTLTDRLLSVVSQCYPDFPHRVSVKT
jgi:hypothetical protein